MMQKFLILFLFVCCTGSAKDFGTRGHVFPVEEENLKLYIKRQATDEKALSGFKKQIFDMAMAPQPLKGLKPTLNNRSYTIDLSSKVDKDITDQKGQTIAKAGTMINPLEKIQLSSGLLFLDGTNKTQLSWAKSQIGNFKWILVCGKPTELEEKENRFIYFDQGGKYTSLFKIQHTPAKVVQKEKLLLIEEVALTKET